MIDTDASNSRRGDSVGNHQVRVERKVWTVLLDGAEGLHEDRAVGDQAIEVRGPEFVESAGSGRYGG